jgi:hypothetical protein
MGATVSRLEREGYADPARDGCTRLQSSLNEMLSKNAVPPTTLPSCILMNQA